MRFLSVCSGIEAASVAWEPLGWKAVGFSEIEPFPCAVLAHRFPNTPNYGSLTEYQKWPVGPGTADVLVGGCPCQSFSVAGLRRGMQDPRGNLTLTYLGLADKVKPKWIVYENVPGLLSSNGGRDFGAFLGALVQLGYGFAYRVLDAQHFGVPQRRRRVFVVACLGAGGWESAAKVLFEPESLSGDTAKGRKKGQGVASDAQGGAGASGRKWPADTACTLNASFGEKQGLEDQHALGGGSLFVPSPICMSSGQANAAISQDLAHTLNATHETQTIATPIVIDRAAFNQGEKAQFDPHIEQTDVMDPLVAKGPHAVGVPRTTSHWDGSGIHPTLNQSSQSGGGIGYSNQELFSQGGGGLVPADPVPFRKSKRAQSTTDDESWVEAGEANTLNNFDLGDTRTTHAVVAPQVYENHPNDSRVTGPLEVSPTVVSRFGTGGGNVPLVNNEPTAITFQPGNLRREAGADPSTTTTTTLKASAGDQMPHVAYCAEVTGTLTVGHHSCAGHQHRMGDNSFLIGDQTPHVAHPVVPLDGMNLLSRLGDCGETHSMQNFDPNDPQFTLRKGGSQHGVLTPMAVRRLTPTECMRLQGFPDDWARIPWKGKPADQCPDGPQYKAAGNSMAVPVMRWIGSRIAAVEQLSNQPTK